MLQFYYTLIYFGLFFVHLVSMFICTWFHIFFVISTVLSIRYAMRQQTYSSKTLSNASGQVICNRSDFHFLTTYFYFLKKLDTFISTRFHIDFLALTYSHTFNMMYTDLGIRIDSKSVDQVTTNQTWLFQSMKHFSNLAYLGNKLLFLVLDSWKVVTNILIKAVPQVLLFSGVTTFNSLSADFKSMLMPRSGCIST